jgi:signal transduction histidine kinase
VIRHARAGRADVTVRHAEGRLVVEVTDDGRARPGNGSGNGSGQGILGMRERARALGGSLEAGPRPGGGFRVLATLPVGTP